MQFVLDNSVVMRWLFADGRESDLAYADHVLDVLVDPDAVAVAPSVWPLEVANVIARAEAKALISEARSAEFLRLLDGLAVRIDRDTASNALGGTLHLARRYALSAYEASYLELALRQGLPMATLDQALHSAGQKAGVTSI